MCGKRGNKRCAKLGHIIPCDTHEGRYYSRYYECVSCVAAAAREDKAAKQQHAKALAEETIDHDACHPNKKSTTAKKLKHLKKIQSKEMQSTEKNGKQQQRWEGRGKRKRKAKNSSAEGGGASHNKDGEAPKKAIPMVTIGRN